MEAFSITAAMVDFINALDLGDGCSTRVPYDRPGRFQTVRNLGGEVLSKVCYTTLEVQCWALDEVQADADARAVKLAVETKEPPAGVHRLRVAQSGYPWYDDSTRCPRYQLVVQAIHQLTK